VKGPEQYGVPCHEGCILAVRKSSVVLPDGVKLAWIIVIDGEVKAMIDAENNDLY